MSQTLGRWNSIIFIGQIVLLAVVAGAAEITHASSQSTVIGGLLSVIVLTAMNALSAMKQERGIVYDLSLSNACGLVSLYCLVSAIINHGGAPANVAPTLYLGSIFFSLMSFSWSWSAARVAKMLGAQGSMLRLFITAAPLGIEPIYDMIMRRRAGSANKKA